MCTIHTHRVEENIRFRFMPLAREVHVCYAHCSWKNNFCFFWTMCLGKKRLSKIYFDPWTFIHELRGSKASECVHSIIKGCFPTPSTCSCVCYFLISLRWCIQLPWVAKYFRLEFRDGPLLFKGNSHKLVTISIVNDILTMFIFKSEHNIHFKTIIFYRIDTYFKIDRVL